MGIVRVVHEQQRLKGRLDRFEGLKVEKLGRRFLRRVEGPPGAVRHETSSWRHKSSGRQNTLVTA